MTHLSDSLLRHLREVADLPDLTGTRYRLEAEIGRGGMGVVYAATDRDLDRRVAIKVLDSTPLDSTPVDLTQEARVIARLEHPAIVPIYGAGTLPDGRAFYAMKLVMGARVDRYLNGGPSLSERLRVIQKVGDALAFAHTCGILHRDLKPQNVMVGSFGEVYVMDWGVDGVAGTPEFRAPEQAAPESGPLDRRSDVYALGALLQFVLPESAPAALRAIAAKAMSAAPAARYPDVPALLLDIGRFQEGLAVEAHRESPRQQASRFAARNAVLLWLLAAYVGAHFVLFLIRNL
jgi:eukaryotic-like serine/threonine-protein kinase